MQVCVWRHKRHLLLKEKTKDIYCLNVLLLATRMDKAGKRNLA